MPSRLVVVGRRDRDLCPARRRWSAFTCCRRRRRPGCVWSYDADDRRPGDARGRAPPPPTAEQGDRSSACDAVTASPVAPSASMSASAPMPRFDVGGAGEDRSRDADTGRRPERQATGVQLDLLGVVGRGERHVAGRVDGGVVADRGSDGLVAVVAVEDDDDDRGGHACGVGGAHRCGEGEEVLGRGRGDRRRCRRR